MEDDTDKLYKAVQEYIENRGGSVVVIGGTSIIQFPDDRKYIYSLAIKIAGRKPEMGKQDE
jgi:hypothetical protein